MSLKNLIEEISQEIPIHKAFIEKDWYAVELLKLIDGYQKEADAAILFTGGTSLSKGHRIIERFSEDIDMLAKFSDGSMGGRSQRGNFRDNLCEKIGNDDKFKVIGSPESRNTSKFFKVLIQYEAIYEHASIRDELQLEISFLEANLPPVECSINSIISDVSHKSDNLNMLCVSPIEIAGDKLSAIAWRLLDHAPNDDDYDKTIIRHIHDLSALEDMIKKEKEYFISCAQKSFAKDIDDKRGNEKFKNLAPQERLKKVLDRLNNQEIYKEHYTKYISAMSYAKVADKIDFAKALASLENICKLM